MGFQEKGKCLVNTHTVTRHMLKTFFSVKLKTILTKIKKTTVFPTIDDILS